MALSHVGTTEGTTTGGSAASVSVTRSCTAGNSLIVCVRWYGAFTISSATCTGETVSIVGSAAGNGTANLSARSQFVVINNIQSTASKTVTINFSGSTSNATASATEVSGTDTAGVAGAHPAASTGTATSNPSHSVTTTRDGSALIGILMSSQSGATPGTGYSTLGFGSFWSYEFGERTTSMDAGTAGAKTIGWTNGSADWHIDALEILVAGGGDVTAPVLSSPTATTTGTTTASGTVSTDEGNGTLYWYVSANASESSATIQTGSSQAVSGTGVQNVSVTGQTAGTTRRIHYVHVDAATNESNVVSSSTFTLAPPLLGQACL